MNTVERYYKRRQQRLDGKSDDPVVRFRARRDARRDADDDIQWITMNGAAVPIKGGQTKEEAVNEFLASKGSGTTGAGSSKENVKQALKSAEDKAKDASAHYEAVSKRIGEIADKDGWDAAKKYKDWYTEASERARTAIAEWEELYKEVHGLTPGETP